MYKALVNFCQIATRQKKGGSKVKSLIESCYIFHWLLLICALQDWRVFLCVWCFLLRFFSDFHDIQELFLKMSNAFSWSENMESQPRANVCVKVHMYPTSWYSPQIHSHHFALMHKSWEIITRRCWVWIFVHFSASIFNIILTPYINV